MKRSLSILLFVVSGWLLLAGCEQVGNRKNFNDLLDKQTGQKGLSLYRKRLRSKNWKRQLGALNSLTNLKEKAAPALPDILALLDRSRNFRVRYAIVRTMTAIGKPAVPTLIRALDTKNLRTRSSIIWALGRIGPQAAMAVPHLIPSLNSTFRDTRRVTLRTLSMIGKAASSSTRAVVRIAKTGNVRDRMEAIRTLGFFGNAGIAIVPELQAWAEDSKTLLELRLQSLQTLARLFRYQRTQKIVDTFLKVGKSNETALLVAVSRGLAEMGYKGREVMKLLRKLNQHPKRRVYLNARDAVEKLKKVSGVRLQTAPGAQRAAPRKVAPANRPSTRPAVR